MPLTPSQDSARPRRRSLLAAAAGLPVTAGLVAGCSDSGAELARKHADAARRIRKAAVRESEILLARYESTAGTHPALVDRLDPLRTEVVRHIEAFGGGRSSKDGESDKSGGDGRRGAGGGGAGSLTAVPADEKAALTTLAEAERRTADARTRALAEAPPELARLLASVAASGAVHAYLLTEADA